MKSSVKDGKSEGSDNFEDGDIRLVLIVTNACNLKCKYCIVPNLGQHMSWENLRQAVDFLFTSKKRNLQIHFFGGEPLMMSTDLLMRTIIYAKLKAKKHDKYIDFMISTNGVPITYKKILFFKKYGVRLEFSIDGGPETQNANRPQLNTTNDSYSLATRHIPSVLKMGVTTHVSSVITPACAHSLVEDFLHNVNDLKFKEVFLMIATTVMWSEAEIEILKEKLEELKFIYLKLLEERGIILFNPFEWLPPFRINTEMVADVDGMVYPACCVVYTGDEKVKNRYAIGHLRDFAVDGVDEVADAICKKRLPNDLGIEILIDEKVRESNILASNVMSEFSKSLSEIIKNNPKLYDIYSRKQQKFGSNKKKRLINA